MPVPLVGPAWPCFHAGEPPVKVHWTFTNATQEYTIDCTTTLELWWGDELATIPHNLEVIPEGTAQ